MARIGLRNFRYSHLTEDENGNATYDGAKNFGRAIDCKVNIETNSTELYADDSLAESDYTFKSGTVDIGIDEDDDEVVADILGQNKPTASNGEIVRTATDSAPYVGMGRIITKQYKGVRKYKVEFLCKVKFKVSMPDEKTKGESLEFSTPTLSGTVHSLNDAAGTWSKTQTFTTYEAASEYLDSLMAAKDN